MDQPVYFSARCALCGNQSFRRPDRLALEARMECDVCGHAGTVVEFADIAVLEAMLGDGTEANGLLH